MLRKGWPVASAIIVLTLTGCSSPEKTDPCGPRSLLRENLRVAAEQNPVPAWNISMETRADFWLTLGNEDQVQDWLQTRQLQFTIHQDQAELIFWAEQTTGKEPGHSSDIVRFPKGDLRPDAPVAQILNAVKNAVAAGQAEIIGARSYHPLRAPTGARDGYHEWNLPDAYRWNKDEGPTFACVTKTIIAIADDGPPARLDLPMLQVGAQKFVGFAGGKAVTLEHQAGLFGFGSEIYWYKITGLK